MIRAAQNVSNILILLLLLLYISSSLLIYPKCCIFNANVAASLTGTDTLDTNACLLSYPETLSFHREIGEICDHYGVCCFRG